MRRAYSTAHCELEVPDYHPFPKYKYRAVAEALKDRLEVRDAPAASWEALSLAHTPEYLRKLQDEGLSPQEAHKVGLPWTQSLLTRALYASGGTLAATHDALQTGLGMNLAGGTHHAHPDRAEGYCIFNDVAVSALNLRAEGWNGRVLVVDLDAHQGNGTAVCFQNDPSVFTLSVHAERNYPLKKERSSLDVGLEDKAEDGDYLEALEPALDTAFASKPDLVFYNSGVDILHNDRFGRLEVSLEGLAKRDRRVFERVKSANVPLVIVMGGGYNRDPHLTVSGHTGTYQRALETFG